VECAYRGYAPGKTVAVHRAVYSAMKAAKKEDEKTTEALLDKTFVEITRQAVAKALRKGSRMGTARAAAKLVELRGPGGADPTASARGRIVTSAQVRASAYGAAPPLPSANVSSPDEGVSQFDGAAAKKRLAGIGVADENRIALKNTAPQDEPVTTIEEDSDDDY
jgi:hypothetical protein